MTDSIPYASVPVLPLTAHTGLLVTLAMCHFIWAILLLSIIAAAWFMEGVTSNWDAVMLISLGAFDALVIVSGCCILARKLRWLSFAIAAPICLIFPVGTVLGVFAIVTLRRPSVAALYQR